MKYVCLAVLAIYVMIIIVLVLKAKLEIGRCQILRIKHKLNYLKINQMLLDAKLARKYSI